MISSRQLAKEIHKELLRTDNQNAFIESVISEMNKANRKHLIKKTFSYLLARLERTQQEESFRVTCAVEPTEETIEAIKKIAGCEKEPVVSIDPGLIGGFTSEYKGVLINGNIKHHLAKLKRALAVLQ